MKDISETGLVVPDMLYEGDVVLKEDAGAELSDDGGSDRYIFVRNEDVRDGFGGSGSEARCTIVWRNVLDPQVR